MSASLLTFVQNQIVYYGTTSLLILGNLGNVCIVLIFSQNRHNACSMYLIAGAVMNSVSLSFNVPHYLGTSVYGDLTASSLVYCKLHIYLANVWGQMSRYFIVAACIDRYALTSDTVRVRAFSRPSVALWFIGIVTVIWHIFPIHYLIFYSIMNGRCGAYGPYYIFSITYNLVFIWLIPCAAMVIFGYIAYSHIKQLHARVRPIGNDRGIGRTHTNLHQRDRDLFIMLLTEVIAYIILFSLYPCITAEIAITNYTTANKSPERLLIENFVFFFSQFLLTMTNAMPFYIYLAASKAFRNDCKKLMNQCWRRVKRQTTVVHTMVGETVLRVQTK